MSYLKPSLNYPSRRAFLARVAPGSCQASLAEKSLLLDACVQMTGSTRTHTIGLLTQVPQGQPTILRPRLSHSGPEIQPALFVACKAPHVCCGRLIPDLASCGQASCSGRGICTLRRILTPQF